jgi:hypothetical protein
MCEIVLLNIILSYLIYKNAKAQHVYGKEIRDKLLDVGVCDIDQEGFDSSS